jgi:hypothetical protein
MKLTITTARWPRLAYCGNLGRPLATSQTSSPCDDRLNDWVLFYSVLSTAASALVANLARAGGRIDERFGFGLFGGSGAITLHSKSLGSQSRMIQQPQLGSSDHISLIRGIAFMSS